MTKKSLLQTLPLAYALRQSLKNGYSFATFKHDALAALVVSLVALPLAMALSIAVGLPPQYGLYTAIVAGIVVPLLGGSIMQVSGPTAAFVVIVAPIVLQHGLRGLIITEIIAGIMLIFFGIAKLGRYINYVPYPVTTGFTSGIAVVIGTLALNDFFGLGINNLQGEYINKVAMIASHIPTLYWPEALVGIVSLVVMFTSKRILPFIPSPVVGIGIGTLLAIMMQQHGLEIATIGSRFTYDIPGGGIGHGIPPFFPTLHLPNFGAGNLLHWPSYSELRILFVPGLIIAALAALESLLSATVADGMAGTKHDPNSELVAVGIGNIFSGFASGIPATGAIARTSTNIHSGAKTPFSGAMHAVLIMLYVLLLAPALSYIPMASLAALLISVAYRMSHYKQFIRIIQIAPRSDIIVLLICFGFTVFIDMVAGVTAGIVLACFLFIKRIANLTHIDISHAGGANHAHHIKHVVLPHDVMVYHINGSLFFGTAEKATTSMDFLLDHIRTVIIDMENVPLIDITGLVTMKILILDIHSKGRNVILCGKDEITGKIMQKLPPDIRKSVKIAYTVDTAVNIHHP